MQVGTLTEGLLIVETKFSNLVGFQQRHNCLHTQAIPSCDFVSEPLSAPRARHQCEAHAFEFT